MKRSIWWDRNETILKKACLKYWADFDKIMKKEKYWRYDLSDRQSWLPYDVLSKIEDDSLEMCQTCWKTTKQYRDYGGWWTHHCLRHYIALKIRIFFRRIKYKIKYLFTK